jgi:hypothetical protein
MRTVICHHNHHHHHQQQQQQPQGVSHLGLLHVQWYFPVIFLLIILLFFCQAVCIYILNSECVYRRFLIDVFLLASTIHNNVV